MRRNTSCAAILLVILALSQVFPAASQDPPASAENGKRIYDHGESAAGAITAVMGNGVTEVPASVVTCTGCHGPQGRGLTEGGISAPDIRWVTLARPTSPGDSALRKRSAYTSQSLLRAVTLGFDSSGNALSTAMPRFRLRTGDARDLIVYLRTLGTKSDAGVSVTTVRVGVILPPAGLMAPEVVAACRAALAAYFEDFAHRGGIYGRQVDLRFFELPKQTSAQAKALRSWLVAEDIFALVSSFLSGSDEQVAPVLSELRIPLIGAVSSSPLAESSSSYVFYLDGGLFSQAEKLADFVLNGGVPVSNRRLTILVSGTSEETRIAEEISRKMKAAHWTVALLSERQSDTSPKAVSDAFLLLTSKVGQSPILQGAENRSSVVLVPGLVLGPEVLSLPFVRNARLFAAYPILPSDYSQDSLSTYKDLARTYHLDSSHFAAQVAVLCGGRILTESLQRAGRDLSRHSFLDALDSLHQFETGWSPPITFGPQKHIGIPGAHVVELSPQAESHPDQNR